MGIRFSCPNGHPLHVKEYLAGKRGICPSCGAKFVIPAADDLSDEKSALPAAGAVVPPMERAASQSDNPSVVISVSQEAPVPGMPNSSPPKVEVFAPPTTDAIPQVEPVLPHGPQPVVVTGEEQPASPAIKYVVHRERIRRNRTRVAILLLLAVIVLAAVLIWMLVAGPASVGGSEISLAAQSPQCVSDAYVVSL